jgi:hypothetical protein
MGIPSFDTQTSDYLQRKEIIALEEIFLDVLL